MRTRTSLDHTVTVTVTDNGGLSSQAPVLRAAYRLLATLDGIGPADLQDISPPGGKDNNLTAPSAAATSC